MRENEWIKKKSFACTNEDIHGDQGIMIWIELKNQLKENGGRKQWTTERHLTKKDQVHSKIKVICHQALES